MVTAGEALKRFIKNNALNLDSSGRELNSNLCILCGYTCYLEDLHQRKGYGVLKIDLYTNLLGVIHVSIEF